MTNFPWLPKFARQKKFQNDFLYFQDISLRILEFLIFSGFQKKW